MRRGGTYEVLIRYGCAPSDVGGELRVAIGDAALGFTPRATPSRDVFALATVGRLELDEGAAALRASVAKSTGAPVLSLNALYLRRLSTDNRDR